MIIEEKYSELVVFQYDGKRCWIANNVKQTKYPLDDFRIGYPIYESYIKFMVRVERHEKLEKLLK